MSTMTKCQILGRRRDEMVLYILSVLLTQVGKPEGLEYVRVWVIRFIIVYRSSGCDDDGAFWDKRAVREREVFQRPAYQTH